jgi:hypothetical protein
MAKKSRGPTLVRKSASEIPAASPADLDRLRAAMRSGIDTSEIAERQEFHRLQRDAEGELPPSKSIIWEAVQREIKQRHLTVYRLWQMARMHYHTLSQAAVHEFLKGQRQLELPSVEALLAAVDLDVVRRRVPRRTLTTPTAGDELRLRSRSISLTFAR